MAAKRTHHVDLEQSITGDPLHQQAYVFGADKPSIACAVVLNESALEATSGSKGARPGDAEASWRAPIVAALTWRTTYSRDAKAQSSKLRAISPLTSPVFIPEYRQSHDTFEVV
jgi:hypothetical protein